MAAAPAPALPDPAYRPEPGLLCRAWEDGLVVYRTQSGDTHLLDPATAAVLDAVCAGIGTPRAIAGHLTAEAPDVAPDRMDAWLAGVIERLRRLSLIVPADGS